MIGERGAGVVAVSGARRDLVDWRICHPERSEGSRQLSCIPRRARDDSLRFTEMPIMSKLSSISRRGTLPPVHPGRLLRREMTARELSANALARALHVPPGRIVSIANGKRAITAETALRLGRYFGTGGGFWLTLQVNHDLASAEREHGARIAVEVPATA
jgi:addiction module HigA family antidote